MFRRLRNKLILINLVVTTAVLIVSFSSIYAVAQNTTQRRQELTAEIALPGYTQVVVQTMRSQIEAERRESLNSLLISLFTIGILEIIAVAVLSYVVAEAAIQPVREAYEAQKIFIANASHEMKTPITAIMANLEVAEIKDNPWIDNVNQEVKTLAALNQKLLTLARVENAMSAAKTSEIVAIKPWVEQLISQFDSRIKQRKVKFTFKTQLSAEYKVKFSKNDFSQIFSILMDNALKYCDKNITIRLTSKSLIISNDGATISDEALQHIFDRFYQTDKSSEGVGLGLAIAKTLSDRQGWKLSANSKKHNTEFTLTFAR